ncbi:hypothetical protein [Peptostreptococcus porci]|uniref:hypothetical protein n=1 Tax=Peptostreptococcus porci TaxID=2652282 RepID=UPI002A758121|nr:hypothetical protein [Peptostreptococcus porci]MDY2794248.1 hypothetical protein [Peptostreptococcus porci]
MTRKERKSNESRLSNNIKRTATTVIITAAVVGSIGITNSVKAEEPEVRITSSNSIDTTNMNNSSTNIGGSSSVSASPKAEALTSNADSESNSATTGNSSSGNFSINGLSFNSERPLNDGGVSLGAEGKITDLEPMNNDGKNQGNTSPTVEKGTDRNKLDDEKKQKQDLIDKALKDLEELKDLPSNKKDTVKALIEEDRVGNSSLETIKKNLESALEKAKAENEKIKNEKPPVQKNPIDERKEKQDLIDKALKDLEELKDLPSDKRETAKTLIGQDKVGNSPLETIKKNLESVLKIAKEENEKARKEKEKTNESNNETKPESTDSEMLDEITKKRLEVHKKLQKAPNRDVVYWILKERIDGLDERTKQNIEKLMNDKKIFTLGFGEYGDILRELLDGLSDKGGNETWEGIKKNTPKVIDNERSVPEKEKPKAEPRIEKPKQVEPKADKPKEEPKSDKRENNPKVVVPKVEKKPEAKMPKDNKPNVEKKPEAKVPEAPKVEEKKKEMPKVMAPKDNKDSIKPRVIEPKSDSKEKTENKKPENNSPEMKKPEMKSPQKDDMNKKGDKNKKKMNEAPKKENNKNRMSDKMNEAPKNIKKKMLPQMGIQHSIATSLMGLSSLVGAALILFKKNDK